MKEIRLIAADFDRLDMFCGIGGTRQYMDIDYCPIARAMKRLGHTAVVAPYNIQLEDGSKILGDFSITVVERCRTELLAGAEYAVINI